MRKMVAVVVALLVLTGCSAEPVEVEESLEHIETKDEQATEVEPAPLEAQAEETAPADDSPEGQYLALIRQYEDRGPEIADASDEQLLAAAMLACEQLADGVPENEVVVVTGEQPDALGNYHLSGPIMVGARDYLC